MTPVLRRRELTERRVPGSLLPATRADSLTDAEDVVRRDGRPTAAAVAAAFELHERADECVDHRPSLGIDYEDHASEASRRRTSDSADLLKLLKRRITTS